MGVIASVTATLRQFHGKYVATIMGGLITSVNSSPLFLTFIYDFLFLEDGSYESQNIRGYFLCLSIVTILCHMVGVVVFGFSTVDESDYKPFPDTEDARVANGNDSSLNESAERNALMENSINSGSRNETVESTPKCSVIQMLKSPRFTALVLGSALLLCLKYIAINNLNTMLASFGLPQYEASLPFVVPASGVILRPIFGMFADWTRPYFSHIWYLYLAAGMHLLCFLISIYKADNIYILSVFLILWPFASDTASVIQPALVAEDFGSSVLSVNQGMFLSVFAVITYAVQSVMGVVYQAHVPEGNSNCFGLKCFRETFGMGIGVSLLSMSLIILYSYFRHRSIK